MDLVSCHILTEALLQSIYVRMENINRLVTIIHLTRLAKDALNWQELKQRLTLNYHSITNHYNTTTLIKGFIFNQSISDTMFEVNAGMISILDTYNVNLDELLRGNIMSADKQKCYLLSNIASQYQRLYFEDFIDLSIAAWKMKLYDTAISYIKYSIYLHSKNACRFKKQQKCKQYNFRAIKRLFALKHNHLLHKERKLYGENGRTFPNEIDEG